MKKSYIAILFIVAMLFTSAFSLTKCVEKLFNTGTDKETPYEYQYENPYENPY